MNHNKPQDILLTNIHKLIAYLSQHHNEFSDQLAELRRISENLCNNPKLSVGFFGMQGSGKSSLINSILGQDILYTSAKIATSKCISIEWGTPRVEIVSKQNQVDQLDISKLKGLGIHGGIDVADDVEICAFVDNPYLKDGLVLVDTPGYDAGIGKETDDATSERYLNKVTMAVIVADITKPGQNRVFELIDKAIVTSCQVIVALNRADLLDSDELDEARTTFNEFLQEHKYNGVPVYVVSSESHGHDTNKLVDAIRDNVQLYGDVSWQSLANRVLVIMQEAAFNYTKIVDANEKAIHDVIAVRKQLLAVARNCRINTQLVISKIRTISSKSAFADLDVSSVISSICRNFSSAVEKLCSKRTTTEAISAETLETYSSLPVNRLLKQMHDQAKNDLALNQQQIRNAASSYFWSGSTDNYELCRIDWPEPDEMASSCIALGLWATIYIRTGVKSIEFEWNNTAECEIPLWTEKMKAIVSSNKTKLTDIYQTSMISFTENYIKNIFRHRAVNRPHNIAYRQAVKEFNNNVIKYEQGLYCNLIKDIKTDISDCLYESYMQVPLCSKKYEAFISNTDQDIILRYPLLPLITTVLGHYPDDSVYLTSGLIHLLLYREKGNQRSGLSQLELALDVLPDNHPYTPLVVRYWLNAKLNNRKTNTDIDKQVTSIMPKCCRWVYKYIIDADNNDDMVNVSYEAMLDVFNDIRRVTWAYNDIEWGYANIFWSWHTKTIAINEESINEYLKFRHHDMSLDAHVMQRISRLAHDDDNESINPVSFDTDYVLPRTLRNIIRKIAYPDGCLNVVCGLANS